MYKVISIAAAVVIASTVSSLAQNYATVEDVATVQDQTTSLQTSINTLNADVDRRLGRQGTAIGTNTASISDHTRRLDAQNIELHRQRTQINTVEHSARVSEERINTLHSLRHAQNARIDALEAGTVTGAQGEQGVRGATGATGADGAAGAQGARGERGFTGAAGLNGQDGQDGRDGRDAFINIKDLNKGIAGSTALGFANQGGAGLGFGLGSFDGSTALGASYTHEINDEFTASFGATTAGNFGAGVKWKF